MAWTLKILLRSTAAAVVLAAVAAPANAADKIKNVIVMIADGSGFNTLQATRDFTGAPLAVDGAGWTSVAQSTYPLRTSTSPVAGPAGLVQDPNTVYNSAKAWDTTPVPGNSTVPGFTAYPAGFQGNEFVRATYPDSANTMSSMMTGVKTYNNAVNVDGSGVQVLSLAEFAKSLGKSTGVVTSVQISDATPAAGGGAHSTNRGNHADIAYQMFGSGTLDVIAGTGNPDYNNNGQLRATADYNWIPADLWNDLKNGTNASGKNGDNWTLVQSRAGIQAIATDPNTGITKLAMIAEAFDGTQEYRDGGVGGPDAASKATYVPFTAPLLSNTPTLWESTNAALNVLGQNDNGLFLMVEGGAVDRAMHSNNLGRMIEEYVDFNATVQKVVDWVNSSDSDATWDNTLLIVTADHDHNLYGPDGATTDPFQDLVDNGPGNLPGYLWLGGSHSNNLIPLFAYGAGSSDIDALADQLDTYTDAQGRTFGRGRYTDQAELGAFLLGNLGNPAGVPEPASWAMLIAGFGLAGTAMRRRRLQSVIA